ncbi:MAG: right-handed parallel beta-helix repeat-containing protein [Candidatus Bathyarchaeales archaeon]
MKGSKVDGGNKAISNYRYVGILCRNVKPCTISNNVVHSLYPPSGKGSGPQTFGIMVYGDSEIAISQNEIRDFSRGGIGVCGDAGPGVDPSAVIEDNVVYGNGLESETGWWAENGIQVGYGATAHVKGNYVYNCTVNNPSWSATGILVVDTSDVVVESNYVEGCDIGIGAVDFPGSIYGPP